MIHAGAVVVLLRLVAQGEQAEGRAQWVVAPNGQGGARGSQAKHHGDFDDDEATLEATIARILDNGNVALTQLAAPLPSRCLRERRVELKQQLKW